MMSLFLLIFLWNFSLIFAKSGLCEVETGQSNIILDIEESRGSFATQQTTPAELPITGDPFSDILLDLNFPKGRPLFILNGKKLQLLQAIDRDNENISHVVFQLTCTVKSSHKKRTIPIIVRVSDINDNRPEFINGPFEITISELTPIGTTIFQFQARDLDTGVNGQVEYFIIEGNSSAPLTNHVEQVAVGERNKIEMTDKEIEMENYKQLSRRQKRETKSERTSDGYGYFAIKLPHQGQVTVERTLDYEKVDKYLLTVVVSDRARNISDRLSSTTTLTVNIRDDDDQDPSFIYQGCMVVDGGCVNAEYSAEVQSNQLSGLLQTHPAPIQAVDMDTLNSPISYSFLSGTPASFREYFQIEEQTGRIRQIKAVDSHVVKKFEIIIKAEERSKRSTTAKLTIHVLSIDANPPEIKVSSTEGFVPENSPIGSPVLDELNVPVLFTVTDKDLGPEDPQPEYKFELTTSSFKINDKGILVVNEENLDRDPPSVAELRFQVVARTLSSASAPLSMSVKLLDVNDNPPVLPVLQPVKVPAGEGTVFITKINATDLDTPTPLIFSLFHVSNNGLNHFLLNPSGNLYTKGTLHAGEHFSLTIQVSDGELSSQGILEVEVVKGVNRKGPEFEKQVYEAEVSEGVSINSTVLTVTAKDPEGDPVTYSITSGNDLRQFSIGTTTGVVTVIRKLDREDLTRYQLIIKAEDSGKLSTTTTVNILVTDINDKNPTFLHLPYVFTVPEGINGTIGIVKAVDEDEGLNGEVIYHIADEVPFKVDRKSGEVFTKFALDYEMQKEYVFVITATDSAPDARLSTATVTVYITDREDELPVFHKQEYVVEVEENRVGVEVAAVMADDPDTVKQITYIILQGPLDLFRIDSSSGKIYTRRGLDYEKDSQHILVIGTDENNVKGTKGATCRVIVNVLDQNDIPPLFTTHPSPLTINASSPVGKHITSFLAVDGDGTSPGNKVRYELIGRGKSKRLFRIDPDLGELSIAEELTKEQESEFMVDIRAYDLGTPQLSSTITQHIFLRRSPSGTSNSVGVPEGASFSDDEYTVQVKEDAAIGSIVKVVTVVNKGADKCFVTKGNEMNIFHINTTSACMIYLDKPLDYESITSYILHLQLTSGSKAVLAIQVLDINDNKPYFVDEKDEKILGRIVTGIGEDVAVGTPVIRLKAVDKDSPSITTLMYSVTDSNFFSIDSSTGLIITKRTFEGVDEQFFHLVAKVTDGFEEAEIELVINLLRDIHRLILPLTLSPSLLSGKESTIASLLSKQLDIGNNVMVKVEKITSRQLDNGNGTIVADEGSDVWLYLIDKDSGMVMKRMQNEVQSLVDMSASSSTLSETFNTTVYPIHPPFQKVKKAVALNQDVFPYAFIIIACLIFILGGVGIIYICISWTRYKNFKQQVNRNYIMPNIVSPPQLLFDPNLKEYETQVLQMTVPVDDTEDDLQLDFSAKCHRFIPEESTPVTTRASSVLNNNNTFNSNNSSSPNELPVTNPLYHRTEETLSPSNANVSFRKDYSYDRSPVETTTEL